VRGLFEGRVVTSLLTGEPEYLEPLKDEAPKGWIVTGYPWYAIDTPAHNAFKAAYEKRWGENLKMGSMVGYNMMLSIAAALEKSPSLETNDLVAAMKGLQIETPMGPVTYRKADHQATMGAWVGRTDVVGGQGKMVGWRYVDGNEVLPPPAEAKAMRPSN
jgi:branched-chain amino acid transport system substrate-binding protein